MSSSSAPFENPLSYSFRPIKAALLLSAWLAGSAPGWGVPVDLADGAVAKLPVVISAEASDKTRKAADDLAQTLGRMTGAAFRVEVGDGVSGIVVGTAGEFPGVAAGEAFVMSDPYREEDYLLRTSPGRVALIGATDLGADHAVWDFLHRLGYRQYFPAKAWEVVPQHPRLSADIDAFEKPDYTGRWIWYNYGSWSENDFEGWVRKNRTSSRGQGGFLMNTGHAYGAIMRAFKTEFEEDDHLLSELNGKRTSKLNIGNPEVRNLAVRYALNYFERNPKAYSISMDPSDGGGWGNSPEELAIGTPSDRVVYLANEVAQKVNEQFPGKFVGIYAYNEHATPPAKFRVHPHVFVGVATSYITGGLRLDQIIEGWKKAGAQNLGIRDYLSIFSWSQDRPGMPRAASLDSLARTIPDYHRQGARFYSAESGDNWGPCGLGYYFASRMLWDLSEASRKEEIATEFVKNCFPEAEEPMTRFYRNILHPDSQKRFPLNPDTIGRMFRVLKEAREMTKDESALARLDCLTLYTQYLVHLYRFTHAKKGERQPAFEEMLKFAYRIRDTGMMHSYALWRDMILRHKDVRIPEEAAYKRPEGENPWKSSEAFDRLAIDGMINEGIENFALLDFEPVYFSRNLVPASRLPEIGGGDERKPVLMKFRGRITIYTGAGEPAEPISFEARAGLFYKNRGNSNFRLHSMTGEVAPPNEADAAAGEDAPVFEPPIAEVSLPPGTTDEPIQLKVAEKGEYRVMLDDKAAGTLVRWPKEQFFTLEFSSDVTPTIVGLHDRLVFYVPRGTKSIGAFATGRGTVMDPEGTKVFELTGEPGYINVPVNPADTGKCWFFQARNGALRLMTVPPFMAPSGAQLLVPAEVVEQNSR